MEEKIKNLVKAVFVIVGFSIVAKILGFFMRVVLSRELGAEALGIYQIALSFFYVFCTVVASGIPVTISHLSSKYAIEHNTKKEGQAVSASLVIGIVFSIIICVIVISFKNVIVSITNETSNTILLFLLPAIFATAINGSFKGALWGRKKHFENCISDFWEQIIRLILYIVLLKTAPSVTIGAIRAGIGLSACCFISMALSIYYYFKVGGKLYNPIPALKEILKTSLPITAVRLISSLTQPLIAIVVPMRFISAGYTEEQALSLFGIAIGMTLPLLMLPNTLIGSYATALVPELTTSFVKKNTDELNKQIKTAIGFTLFISFCFVPVFMGLGEPIGLLLFNNTTSGYLLTKTSWLMIPMGICAISGSILNTMGLEVKSFKNYCIGAVFLILSIWFLPKYIGIDSLIYGATICICIAGVLNVLMIKKYTKIDNLILKPLLLMSFFTLPSAVLGNWLFGSLKFVFPLFVNVAISCGVSLLCFVALCLILNVVNLTGIFISLKNVKISKKHTNKLRV